MIKSYFKIGSSLISRTSPEIQSDASHRHSPLQSLPIDLKYEIVSYLSPTTLKNLELVSRGLQGPALYGWLQVIPVAQRAEIVRSSENHVWKQAWFSQCAHLEKLGLWGLQASRACKFLPDELNPFDVELRCSQWLESENAYGDGGATRTLAQLFEAIHQKATHLNWQGRYMHSLPPFVDKIKTLETLFLGFNELTTANIKGLPALRVLLMHNNQLNAVNIKELPALEELDLRNNPLTAIDLEDLPVLSRLDLDGNQFDLVAQKLRYALEYILTASE